MINNSFGSEYFTNTTTKGSIQLQKYIEILKDILSKDIQGYKILDVGCATGELGKLIGETNHYTGIDISTDAINIAVKNRTKEIFYVCDINKESIDDQFDLVFMLDVIEHLRNFEHLEHLLSNQKPGSLVIITTPNGYGAERFILRSKSTPELDKTHKIIFSPYTLDFYLKRVGYSKRLLCTPYNFYFKSNFITKHLTFGGQIIAIYEKK